MLFMKRMHKQIALLLVMTLLIQSWLLHSGISGVALATPLEQTPVANHNVYLPLISAPPSAPDFVINSPTTKKISGTLYFSIQSTNQQPITEVVFKAGNTELGRDTTASDGFKIFVDVKKLPSGNLELSAIASGPGGTTTKKITVEAIPNPPTSATVGNEGAVVASEIGSVVAIPPGGAPTGTTITIDERTQQEVTNDTGIDWEGMGVTFLGAQQIDSNVPFTTTFMVSSAGFGNRVQPGQAVVNYMILPDIDGVCCR
ncbi:MAG: hypothetical protein U0175_32865 [Caldilineaceae bacterium]